MINVLFVCLGNICRSPIAEGIFQSIVKRNGSDANFNIDSCGTAAYHVGEQPDARMKETALKHGVKLDHRGRQIQLSDLDLFDHILVMDNTNYSDVTDLCHNDQQRQKVKLLRDYDNVSVLYNEVPDPYYGGSEGFEDVYRIAAEACENLYLVLE